MPKVIIVTGGAGFLGRNLCKKLLQDENNRIICIDNLVTGRTKNITEFTENFRFRFIEHDITDTEFSTTFAEMLPVNIDEIYHLACIASPPKYKEYSIETLMTSFVGTKNVLDLAKRYGAKVLFTSTSEVYGDPLVHPQPEEYFGNVNTFGERSCYDEGKRVAESLIYEYRRKFGLDVKIVRIFNTYGPYMDIDDGRVITNFIKQILANKPLIIYGDGTQGRSFCYVDDMIDGLIKMMDSEKSFIGPVNIGNPCEFTIIKLAETILKLSKSKSKIIHKLLPSDDPRQRQPNIELAKTKLGWEPKITLEDGLRETIQYFKNILYS